MRSAGTQMKRREFIALLGGAGVAAALPLAARAQAMPTIGFLNGQIAADVAHFVAAFRESLKAAGFVEGQNVAIDYRYANGDRDILPALANEFVRRGVAVIVTTGGTPVTIAAKKATATVPIVFAIGGDPVLLGVVESLNRPGGNATGACFLFNAIGAKRLDLLLDLVPKAKAKVIGYLVNPTNPSLESEARDMHAAALSRGLEIRVQQARNEQEIDAAFSNFAQQRVEALMLAADVFFTIRREQITTLAARHKLAASYHSRELVEAGGLMCYGPSQMDGYRQAGTYTARILKGEAPADLPVQQATKFDFFINLKAAKGLGLTVPPTLLAIADEVIE
jgi:putative ABC transport system substrate-binding protein